MTGIGEMAFSQRKELVSIAIPDSVTSIDGAAFSGCTGLTSVVIPDSVTRIGAYVFDRCSSLTTITFDGTMEQWTASHKRVELNDSAITTTVHCTDGDIAK